LLVSVALLHDMGMAARRKLSETSADIRLDHFTRTKNIVVKYRNYFGFSKHEALVVGEICRSHGTVTLAHLRDEPFSIAEYGTIRMPLLCALLRLSDVLDLTATRAPNAVAAWRKMHPDNRIHWDVHDCISDVRITAAPSWEIAINAIPEKNIQERKLIELRNWVQDELDLISPILRTAELYYRRVDLFLHPIAIEKSRREFKNPFLELAPFRAKDAARFAGRGRETGQLVEQVLRRKLTVVIGESGVGKTSLVDAGLVPRLKDYGFDVVRFSFHGDPLGSLAESIAKFDAGRRVSGVKGRYRKDNLSVAIEEAVKRKRKIDRLLIIGDHLEQMFTIGKRQDIREPFARGFYRLLDTLCPAPVSFLFCMRQDYLADLYDLSQHIPELYERENTFKLYRLSRENGKEVLETAASYARIKLSAELIEQILEDLCGLGEGVIYPPYFQIVGYRLYAAANRELGSEAEMIPKRLYDKLGGAEEIINHYFDSLLDHYSQTQKPLVGQILKEMVTTFHTKKRVTREQLESLFPEHVDLDFLLNSLVKNRIVRRSLDEYELIHDCIAQRVVELVKQQTFLSPPVRKALRFMEENYYNSDLRSADIARASGVTAVHLATLFHWQLRRRINIQLNTIRINAAKRLLSNDRRPIDEIRREVGFKSLSSFSRKFNELEDISPLQYRKKLIAANLAR